MDKARVGLKDVKGGQGMASLQDTDRMRRKQDGKRRPLSSSDESKSRASSRRTKEKSEGLSRVTSVINRGPRRVAMMWDQCKSKLNAGAPARNRLSRPGQKN